MPDKCLKALESVGVELVPNKVQDDQNISSPLYSFGKIVLKNLNKQILIKPGTTTKVQITKTQISEL